MKRFGSIYKIVNKMNGKMYVGQTTQTVQRRFIYHCTSKICKSIISDAIRKYGKHNFEVVELVVAFDKQSLDEYELYFYNLYNTAVPNGYNIMIPGNQPRLSKESLKKMSNTKIGKPNYKARGIKRSLETKLLFSKVQGGKPILATCVKTGRNVWFLTLRETGLYGFNPKNVNNVLSGRRPTCKGWKFSRINDANQSGSISVNTEKHAQRLGIETLIRE